MTEQFHSASTDPDFDEWWDQFGAALVGRGLQPEMLMLAAFSVGKRRPTADMVYYAKAVGLIADTLNDLKPEELEERRAKMVATLRMAAYWFGGDQALNITT